MSNGDLGWITNFIWGIADDVLRDLYVRGKYRDVILPMTVLRRLDCVLAATKEKVLKRRAELRGKGLQDLDAQLRRVSGFAFYNTSRYDFEKLLADDPVAADFTCARLMGLDPYRVWHLARAAHFLGNAAPDGIDLIGEGLPLKTTPFDVLPEFASLRMPL